MALVMAAVATAAATATLVALEGGEVAVIRTHGPDAAARDTRVWIAEDAAGWWVEAASPEREFVRDVLRTPTTQVRRDGRWHACRAEIAANPAGHERIRTLLAAKYGWKDRWIGLVADTSRSLGVRLSCEAS
jgi:hypothetical protein